MERLAGRIILLWGWRRTLTALAAGAFASLGQAPYDFFAAGFVSFPVLVWLLDGAAAEPRAGLIGRLKPAASVGWWFGFGYFLAGLWWIGGALLAEGDALAWALPFAVLGIPALLAFFHAFAAALARLMWSDGVGRIAALAFAFGLAEWLRSFLFTGFPWNAIGYAAMPVPAMMQSAAIVGLTGMNALAVFVFATPALLAARRGLRTGLALALALAAAHIGYGYYRLGLPHEQATKTLSLRIVQPSIDQAEKWDRAVRDRIFATLLELTSAPPQPGGKRPDLVLWPETAVPFLFTDRPEALGQIGQALADDQMLLTGAVRTEEGAAGTTERFYNAVVAIDGKGEIVDAVDKVHLVPFGEYLPFGDLLNAAGLQRIVQTPLDFSPGSQRQTLALPGGITALPFICYEIIFPDLVNVEATPADVLVNVTNDAWFGDTPGLYQHFRQAQLRSVETSMPLIRAANTGISGVVDADGRIVDALAVNQRGVIDLVLPIPPRREAAVDRNIVGFSILAALALAGAGLSLGSRLRAN